jgi:hypothetical protein
MVQSNLAFEELSQTGLAGLGTGQANSSRVNTSDTSFLCPGSKWDDLNIFSDHLNDRNMMAIVGAAWFVVKVWTNGCNESRERRNIITSHGGRINIIKHRNKILEKNIFTWKMQILY